jgi:hypothetical protein
VARSNARVHEHRHVDRDWARAGSAHRAL